MLRTDQWADHRLAWGRSRRLQFNAGIAGGVNLPNRPAVRQLAHQHRDGAFNRRCRGVVVVVQPVDLRNLDDASGGEWRDRS